MTRIKQALERAQNDITQRRERETAAKREMERLKNYDLGILQAREAGDLELYTQLSKERDRIREALSALNKELSGPVSDVSKETLVSLWQEDTAEYNRVFEKKLAAYDKARKALCEAFMELVDMQQAALELRESTARTILDLEPEAEPIRDLDLLRLRLDFRSLGLSGLATLPVKAKPVLLADYSYIYPDAAFFIVSGDISQLRQTYINRVAGRQLP